MLRIAAAAALLCLTGTAHAADDVCDKPVGKLTANQYFDCSVKREATVKARQKAAPPEQQTIRAESRAETERKLLLRQPVAGEVPIVAPYREIPLR